MGLLDEAIREHLDLKRSRGADPAEIERAEREALGPVRREPIGGEESPIPLATGSAPYTETEEIGSEWHDPLEQPGDLPGPEFHDPPPLAVTKSSHGSGLRGRFRSRRRQEQPPPDSAVHPPDEDFRTEGDLDTDHSAGYEAYQAEYPAPFDEPVEPAPPDPGIEPTQVVPPSVHGDFDAADVSDPLAPERAESDPLDADPLDPIPPPPFPAEPPEAEPSLGAVDYGQTVEYDIEESLKSEEPDEDVLEETPEFLQDTPEHDRLWFEQRPPRDFDFDG